MYIHLKIGGMVCTLVVKKNNITRERCRLLDCTIGRGSTVLKNSIKTFYIFLLSIPGCMQRSNMIGLYYNSTAL